MEFFENELYHVYNRGNNRQRIFFEARNYEFFLQKVKKYILPHCDILAYCLMPNHFHFLINSDFRTIIQKEIAGKERNVLSEGIRNLLSSYTQAINKWKNATGSLFQQNTKARSISGGKNQYDRICFDYIHQNPLKAGLTDKMELWEYSSFRDYHDRNIESICNRDLAIQLLDLNMKTFYEDSYGIINEDDLEKIF